MCSSDLHAENAIGNALRVEFVEIIDLFTRTNELDRLAGNSAHGERRTTTAITINTRQNNAGDADTLIEILGKIDRILTGQRIRHEQNFMRGRNSLDFGHFRHQRLVNMRAACGIENDNIEALQARGYDIRAIRPPTVPEGTARLRLALTLHVTAADLDALFADLEAEMTKQ